MLLEIHSLDFLINICDCPFSHSPKGQLSEAKWYAKS